MTQVVVVLVLVAVCGLAKADYGCVCNYNVEKNIMPGMTNAGTPIGYIYEFDCKPDAGPTGDDKWLAIAFQHMVGYVEVDTQVEVQTCPGQIPGADMLTTTTPASTIPTTVTTTATKSTPSSTTPTTTVSTTPSTTPTTTSTTQAPTTQTTTSTPKPTTTSPTTTSTSTTSSTTLSTTPTTTTPQTTSSTTMPTTSQTTSSTTIPTTSQTTSSTTMSTTSQTTSSTTMSTTPTTTSQTTAPTTTRTPTKPSTTPMKTTMSSSTTSSTTPMSSSTSTQKTTVFHDWCSNAVLKHAAQMNGHVFSLGTTCYEVVPDPLSWADAEAECKSRGGHLVVITDQSEQSVFNRHVAAFAAGSVWIGLNDINTEQQFEWVTGTKLGFTHWMPGWKDDLTARFEDCVEIAYPAGTWDDVDCDYTMNEYVCEFDTGATTMPTTYNFTQTAPTVGPSTSDWCPQDVLKHSTLNGGHTFTLTSTHSCYEIVPQKERWADAELDCESRGGHLVDISTQTEQSVIYRHMSTYTSHSSWIGLHDLNTEASYEWISGRNVSYTNWLANHANPDNTDYHDCVIMLVQNAGHWNDYDCQSLHDYVCEYDLPGSVNYGSTVGHGLTYPTTAPPATFYNQGDISMCPHKVQVLAQNYGTFLAQHENSCYELLHNKVTWEHGEYLCNDAGGHLVYINNAREQGYIETFLNNTDPSRAVWIGLHDQYIEQQFQWTNGNLVGYTNWVPGHTSNFVHHSEENCVVLVPYKGGQWDDITCGYKTALGDDAGEKHVTLCEYGVQTVQPVG